MKRQDSYEVVCSYTCARCPRVGYVSVIRKQAEGNVAVARRWQASERKRCETKYCGLAVTVDPVLGS